MKSEILEKAFNIVFENKIIKGICLFLGVGTAGTIGVSLSLPSFTNMLVIAALSGFLVIIYALLILCILIIALYMPKAISWKGNIHRAEFFIVIFITNFISVLSRILYDPQFFSLDIQPSTFVMLIGIATCFFMVYLEICTYIKRLNDLKWSKWLAIIALIPYVCLALAIPCTFIKSKMEESHTISG